MSSVYERRRRNVRSVYARPGPKDSASPSEDGQRLPVVGENGGEGDQESSRQIFDGPSTETVKADMFGTSGGGGGGGVVDDDDDGKEERSTESQRPKQESVSKGCPTAAVSTLPGTAERPSSEAPMPWKVGRPRKVDGPGGGEEGFPQRKKAVGRPRKRYRPGDNTPRKMGRPRKIVRPEDVVPKKKVGRPPSVVPPYVPVRIPPKKVGRPRKDSRRACGEDSGDREDEWEEEEEELSLSEWKPHVCRVCQRRYTCTQSLDRHLLTHSKQARGGGSDGGRAKKPKCNICHKVFRNRYTLATHRPTHNKVRPFACNQCDKSYTHKNFLEYHMTLHTGLRPFSCDICHKTYRRNYDLKQHKRVHTGERPFACTVCGQTFTTRISFRVHRKIHSDKKPFKCDECGLAFRLVSEMKQHKRTAHRALKTFPCKVCGERFSTQEELSAHRQSHPKSSSGRVCEVCGKHLKAPTLKVHMMTHTGERPFACEVCDRRFIKRCDWVVHMRKHTGEKPFVCSMCGAGFVTNVDMLRHANSVHFQLRPFTCDVCNKPFMYAQTLKKHKHLHTGIKNHKCDRCDKRYATRGSLRMHMRTHTGEKPFACPHCPMRFMDVGSKNRHARLHTGEKPYKCDQCSAEFSRVEPYKHHRENAHPKTNETCTAVRDERHSGTTTLLGENPAALMGRPAEPSPGFETSADPSSSCLLTQSRMPAQAVRRDLLERPEASVRLGQSGGELGVGLTTAGGDKRGSPCTVMVVQPLETYYDDTMACPAFDIPSAPTVVVESSHYQHHHHDPPCAQTATVTDYVQGLEAGVVVEPATSAYRDPRRSTTVAEFNVAEKGVRRKEGGARIAGGCSGRGKRGGGGVMRHVARQDQVLSSPHHQDLGVPPQGSLEDSLTSGQPAVSAVSAAQATETHRNCLTSPPQDVEINYVESDDTEVEDNVDDSQDDHADHSPDEKDNNGAKRKGNAGDVKAQTGSGDDKKKASGEGETQDDPMSRVLREKAEPKAGRAATCSDLGHSAAAVTSLASEEGQDTLTLTLVKSSQGGHTTTTTTTTTTLPSRPPPCYLIYQDNGNGSLTLLDSQTVFDPSTLAVDHTETVADSVSGKQPDVAAVSVAAAVKRTHSADDQPSHHSTTTTVTAKEEESPPHSDTEQGSKLLLPEGIEKKKNAVDKSVVKIDASLVEETLKTRKRVFGKAKHEHMCEICGRGFTQKSSLNIHLAVVHNLEGIKANIVCDICNKACPSKSMLESHRRSHTGVRPFPCNICGKTYKHKPDLRHHITKYHFGDKPFTCEVCHKSFTEKGSLKAHQLLHQGSRPHKCRLCPKAFTQLSTLRTHERTHTGEKPYVCHYCGKGFTDRATIQRHQRMHTGEKPYKCQLCSSAFARLDQLKKHVSKDHHSSVAAVSADVHDLAAVAAAVASIQ